MGLALQRGAGKAQQAAQLGGGAGIVLHRLGDDAAQHIGFFRVVLQPFGHDGEIAVEVGEELFLAVLDQPVDAAFGQRLPAAHQLVQVLAGVLGFGDRNFLQGVLQLIAGIVELLRQVRAVQQLERRDLLPAQPVFQQAGDLLAGACGIEVLGRIAGRFRRRGAHDALLVVDQALGQDGGGGVVAGLRIQHFLGDAHRGGVLLRQQVLGGGDGLLAVFARHLQGPRGRWRPA